MKTKQNLGTKLHAAADIKQVTQSATDPKVLYIEGYATLYRNELGIKEVDRDMEIVSVQGMDISAFQKNPVLLWNHDWSEVRGKVTSISKDDKGLRVTAELVKLTGKEADFENVLHGNVKSFSIGFIPIDYEYLDDAVEITQSELLEISIAPVQSNRSALFQVVGTKSVNLDNKSLKELLDNKRDNMKINEKDAGQPAEEIKPEVTPEVKPEVKPEESQATKPVEPEVTPEVKPEVKTEVIQPTLDVNALAQQLVEAQVAAEAKKREQAEAAEQAELAEQAAKEQAAKDRVTNALTYIKEQKELLASTPAADIDVDQFDEFVDIITETNSVIMSKVSELSSLIDDKQE